MFKRIIALAGIAAFVTLTSPAVYAANGYQPFGGVCDRADAKNSSACVTKANSSGDPLTGDKGLLNRIANIVAYVAGAVAVIVILLGAFKLITSSGDANNVALGRRMVVGALIGLLIIVFARLIIYFVLSKL